MDSSNLFYSADAATCRHGHFVFLDYKDTAIFLDDKIFFK